MGWADSLTIDGAERWAGQTVSQEMEQRDRLCR